MLPCTEWSPDWLVDARCANLRTDIHSTYNGVVEDLVAQQYCGAGQLDYTTTHEATALTHCTAQLYHHSTGTCETHTTAYMLCIRD